MMIYLVEVTDGPDFVVLADNEKRAYDMVKEVEEPFYEGYQAEVTKLGVVTADVEALHIKEAILV